MSEQSYYENPALWDSDKYLTDLETIRRSKTAALIPTDTMTLLDAGAGNGVFLQYLSDVRPQVTAMGLERSVTALRFAQQCANVIPGSIDNLPFPDRSFDAITALEVIEHLPYTVFFNGIRELQRVSARYIIVSVPYQEERLNTRCPHCGCHFNANYHMRHFTSFNLKTLFPSFCLVKARPITVRKYVGEPVLVRIYNLITRYRHFPTTTECPQCGYSQRTARPSENISGKDRSKAFSLFTIILKYAKLLFPKRSRIHWMICLYERREGTDTIT